MKSKICKNKKSSRIKLSKKLLLILAVVFTTFSCNNDEEPAISVLNSFIGEWTLQSRVINNDIPLEIDIEKLNFTEDNNLSDFSGNYEFITTSSNAGDFIIDLYNVMVFTSSDGDSTPYDFTINGVTLKLSYEDGNSDLISEVWIKDY